MGDVADRRVDSGVSLAEITAAIALVADLGLGQPMEHMLRACILAMRMADRLDLDLEDRDATYWTTLFTTAGCTGTSWELTRFFGDDIEFRASVADVGPSPLDALRFLIANAGRGRGAAARARILASLAVSRLTNLEQTFLAHCAVNGQLADRLSLGDLVITSLLQTFTRWDGKGLPKGVGGEDILMPIRIANLANQVEISHREGGVEKSRSVARGFSGNVFDPAVVELWCDTADELVADLEGLSTWDAVLAAQPIPRGTLSESELDEALALIADYADLKSPWFTGHSRGVAQLAEAAARDMGLPERDAVTIRRAALVHDIGRNGVPNTIWDKAGPLTDAEREKVRLHAYYTDRVLHRAGRLSALGSVASSAHERTNGAGYPRAISGSTIPLLGRLLEAADAYHAMLEPRPHRPALSKDAAARELMREVVAGEFDEASVNAVLSAAGHRVVRRIGAPAGLTPREVEVLVLAARGATTRAIASRLGITPKTAGNHIERIYAKIGTSSRAEAAMFAMHHGLIDLVADSR